MAGVAERTKQYCDASYEKVSVWRKARATVIRNALHVWWVAFQAHYLELRAWTVNNVEYFRNWITTEATAFRNWITTEATAFRNWITTEATAVRRNWMITWWVFHVFNFVGFLSLMIVHFIDTDGFWNHNVRGLIILPVVCGILAILVCVFCVEAKIYGLIPKALLNRFGNTPLWTNIVHSLIKASVDFAFTVGLKAVVENRSKAKLDLGSTLVISIISAHISLVSALGYLFFKGYIHFGLALSSNIGLYMGFVISHHDWIPFSVLAFVFTADIAISGYYAVARPTFAASLWVEQVPGLPQRTTLPPLELLPLVGLPQRTTLPPLELPLVGLPQRTTLPSLAPARHSI